MNTLYIMNNTQSTLQKVLFVMSYSAYLQKYCYRIATKLMLHKSFTHKGWVVSVTGIVHTFRDEGIPRQDSHFLLQDSCLLVVEVITTICEFKSDSEEGVLKGRGTDEDALHGKFTNIRAICFEARK